MRVALVCDWFLPRPGGIEAHLGDLARELARAGHVVEVLTPMPPRADLPPDETLGGGVRVRRLPVPLLVPWSLALPPRAIAVLGAALDVGAYDVVHAHASVIAPFAFGATWAARVRELPCVLTHHSVLGSGARVLGAADLLLHWSAWPVVQTAVSELVARELRHAVLGLRVEVLPNGIRPEAWAMPPRVPRRDGVVTVGAATRLVRRKRPQALVHALARVRTLVPPGVRVRVVIAGDGPARASVVRLARSYGVADDVELLGWQPRDALRAVFARCDVYVAPAARESFGIAALEARCAGLPVVAMRRAGIAGFVRHEREGLLAADDEELVRHLARLVTDDALRARIADHNRRTRPAETWPRVLARHEQLYRRAIALAAQGARERATRGARDGRPGSAARGRGPGEPGGGGRGAGRA